MVFQVDCNGDNVPHIMLHNKSLIAKKAVCELENDNNMIIVLDIGFSLSFVTKSGSGTSLHYINYKKSESNPRVLSLLGLTLICD